ncbi:MAG: GFA family protein [Pseudomonadota bacterium]
MLTGRCYCGSTVLTATEAPVTAAYCHCSDCRRWTGAPVAAFAAFPADTVTLSPPRPESAAAEGVRRWVCPDCGSPLLARFDYLPGQVYVPIGILDEPDKVPPLLHSHADRCIAWLEIDDDLPRHTASARDALLDGS